MQFHSVRLVHELPEPRPLEVIEHRANWCHAEAATRIRWPNFRMALAEQGKFETVLAPSKLTPKLVRQA